MIATIRNEFGVEVGSAKHFTVNAVVEDENVTAMGVAEIKIQDRYQKQDYGRHLLEILEKIADHNMYHLILGFAEDDVAGFYKKCDWIVSEKKYQGKHAVGTGIKYSKINLENLTVDKLW